jgi:hypothetical protein
MNFKTTFSLLILLLLETSCSNQKRLQLGTKINENLNGKTKIFSPTGAILELKEIKYKNISYKLGISKNKEIQYISTIDTKFKIQGLKINDEISEYFNDAKMIHIRGWGYYIKINSEWYAAFNFRTKPIKTSKIEWFFKYDFGESKPITKEFLENSLKDNN